MPERADIYLGTYLSMAAGRVNGEPVLVLTMRPESRSFRACNFSFSLSQAHRMRAELNELLDDPESWLHLSEEQRQQFEAEGGIK